MIFWICLICVYAVNMLVRRPVSVAQSTWLALFLFFSSGPQECLFFYYYYFESHTKRQPQKPILRFQNWSKRVSSCETSTNTKRIFVKFGTGGFSKYLFSHLYFWLESIKNSRRLQWTIESNLLIYPAPVANCSSRQKFL